MDDMLIYLIVMTICIALAIYFNFKSLQQGEKLRKLYMQQFDYTITYIKHLEKRVEELENKKIKIP